MSIEFDGHMWTDRGYGLFIPDEKYEVHGVWAEGKEFVGKHFVVKQISDYDVVVAMAIDWDHVGLIWEMQDRLIASGHNAFTVVGSDSSCIGGFLYDILMHK